MDGPKQRAGEGEGCCDARVCISQPVGQKNPPQKPEQAEGGCQMDQEIQQAVTPGVEAAHRVVQGEGEIHDRPAGNADPEGRGQDLGEGGETADRVVFDDVDLIVEDEGRLKRVDVGKNNRYRQQAEIKAGVLLQLGRRGAGSAHGFNGGRCFHDRSRVPLDCPGLFRLCEPASSSVAAVTDNP